MGREINDNFLSVSRYSLSNSYLLSLLSFHPCFPPISITSLDRVSSIALLNGQNFSNLLVILLFPFPFLFRWINAFFLFRSKKYRSILRLYRHSDNATIIFIHSSRENLNYIHALILLPYLEYYFHESRTNLARMEKQKITIVEARLFRCICTRRWAKSRRRFIEKPSLVHGPIQITILNSRQPLGLANLNVMRTFIVITRGSDALERGIGIASE